MYRFMAIEGLDQVSLWIPQWSFFYDIVQEN